MLTDIANIKKTLDQYIVRPANFFGLGGFVFDVEGDAVVTLTNEITDHYAEDNTVVQDNIAVLPKRVVLQSYVGELADIVEGGAPSIAEKVTRKLTVLNGLLPDLSAGVQQVKDALRRDNGQEGLDIGKVGDISLENALDIYSIVKNFTPPTSKQEEAYQYFKALRDQKIIMSIQTPFEFMTNMAIESVVARQGASTRFVSDFTVTFKEIRTAKTVITGLTKEGRAAQQTQAPDDLGNVDGINRGAGQSIGKGLLDPNDTIGGLIQDEVGIADELTDEIGALGEWFSPAENNNGGVVFRNSDGTINTGQDVGFD